MDARHFDRLAHSHARSSSRRGVLGGLAATLGLAAICFPESAEARRKRKKKLQTNAFRCVAVGGKCRGSSGNCCSGICQGKKPKKGEKDKSICVAHNVGTCQVEDDTCLGKDVKCGEEAVCARTTGDAPFCVNQQTGICTTCSKDLECQALFGAGAACIVCPLQCTETITGCFAPGA